MQVIGVGVHLVFLLVLSGSDECRKGAAEVGR